MGESGRIIRSDDLKRRLVRVAQIRGLICIAAFIIGMAIAGLTLPRPIHPALGIAAIFGPYFLAAWITGRTYCRRAVRCPYCRGSLWSCGSGNFKPRRMKVTGGHCPNCFASIV